MTERQMYERVYGEKFEETKDIYDAAEIAKLIRKDIKQAREMGILPGKVSDYRVRTRKYAGGQSIDVRLLNHPHLWTEATHPHWPDHVTEVLTDEGEHIRGLLNWIMGRYNYDGSEIQVDYFDVRFYGSAEIEDRRGYEFRTSEAAERKERKELVEKIGKATGKTPKELRRYGINALRRAAEKIN